MILINADLARELKYITKSPRVAMLTLCEVQILQGIQLCIKSLIALGFFSIRYSAIVHWECRLLLIVECSCVTGYTKHKLV